MFNDFEATVKVYFSVLLLLLMLLGAPAQVRKDKVAHCFAQNGRTVEVQGGPA